MPKHNQTPFANYWAELTPAAKQNLVHNSGISYKRLSNLARGHTQAGLDAVMRLCSADKRLTLKMLRPDLP